MKFHVEGYIETTDSSEWIVSIGKYKYITYRKYPDSHGLHFYVNEKGMMVLGCIETFYERRFFYMVNKSLLQRGYAPEFSETIDFPDDKAMMIAECLAQMSFDDTPKWIAGPRMIQRDGECKIWINR